MSVENEPSTHNVFDDLNEKVDIIYKHHCLEAEYSTIPRDYGTGYPMTEVEAHTLGFIQKQEGITATQLARDIRRTKGGVSKLISKLESKGLVERVDVPNNKRMYQLNLTKKGRQACEIHREYDRIYALKMIEKVLQDCTVEEVQAFYKVMTCRIRIIEKQYKKK